MNPAYSHPGGRRKGGVTAQPCPCGSELNYHACCGMWHDGGLHQVYPPTAQALMRSRYSAYVMQRADYLLATWHGSTAPGELDLQPVKWLGLELRHAAEQGDAGVVEFVARFRPATGGPAERLHELSRFVREEGRWFYVDGDAPIDE